MCQRRVCSLGSVCSPVALSSVSVVYVQGPVLLPSVSAYRCVHCVVALWQALRQSPTHARRCWSHPRASGSQCGASIQRCTAAAWAATVGVVSHGYSARFRWWWRLVCIDYARRAPRPLPRVASMGVVLCVACGCVWMCWGVCGGVEVAHLHAENWLRLVTYTTSGTSTCPRWRLCPSSFGFTC